MKTGIQFARVLQFILLAFALMGGTASACDEDEFSDDHGHGELQVNALHFEWSFNAVNNASRLASQQKIDKQTIADHQGVALGHQKCKCCDNCKCAVCSGCHGGCSVVALQALVSQDISIESIMDGYQPFGAIYVSPPPSTLEYPPRRLATGIFG